MASPDQYHQYHGQAHQPVSYPTTAAPSGASRRAVVAARTTALFDTLTRSVEDLLSVASPTGSGVVPGPTPAAHHRARSRSRSRSKSRSRSRSGSARSRSPVSKHSVRTSMAQGPGRPLHLHVPIPATPPRSTSTSSSPRSSATAMSQQPQVHPPSSSNMGLPESPARQRHRQSSHGHSAQNGNGVSPTYSASAASSAAGGSLSMESLSVANDMLLRTALSLTSSNHDDASAELDPTLAHLLSQLASTTVELNRALASRDPRTDPLELSANLVVLMTASLALLSRLRCLDGKWRAPLAEHRMDMMQKEHEDSNKVMRADSTFNNTTSTVVHHRDEYHHDGGFVDPRVAGMHTPPPPISSSSTMASMHRHHHPPPQTPTSYHRHSSLVNEPGYSHSHQRPSSSYHQQQYPHQYPSSHDTAVVGSRPSPSRARDPSVRASWHAGAPQRQQGAFNFEEFAQHLSNTATAHHQHHSPTPTRSSHYPPPSMGPVPTSSQSLRYPTTPSRGPSGTPNQGSRPSSPMTQIYQHSPYAAAPAASQSYRQPPPPSPSTARYNSTTPRSSLASIADVSPSLDPAWPESMLSPSATPTSPDRGPRTPRNRPTSALTEASAARYRHASSPVNSASGGHPSAGRDDITDYFSTARPPSPPSFASTVATAGGPAALGGSGSPRMARDEGGVDLHTMATAAGANMGNSGAPRGMRRGTSGGGGGGEPRGMEGFSPFRSVTPQVQGLSPSRQGGYNGGSGAMGTSRRQ